ncbi:MAG: AMP-binding protein [Acetobacteraceae bacterium]
MELKPGAQGDTVAAMFARQVAARGDQVVLRKKDRGIWKATTWSELDADVAAIRRGLQAIDFGRGDVAAVLADTRPEFVCADLAILSAGGATVAINPDEEASRVGHILRSAGCRVVFVEAEEQLDKVLTVRGECPALSRIVIFDMKGLRDFNDPQCFSLDGFLINNGATAPVDPSPAPDDPAVILFPRGPHSGMGHTLTHGDVMHLVTGAQAQLGVRDGDERLAILPMSDVTERILGLYVGLAAGVISNYLESPETAVENLQQLQPTVLGANAEAWERLHARITAAADGATRLQKALYRWAIAAGEAGGLSSALANMLVLRQVRRELGMLRLRLTYIGEESIPAEVSRWTQGLGIRVRPVTDFSGPGADQRYRDLMQQAVAVAGS